MEKHDASPLTKALDTLQKMEPAPRSKAEAAIKKYLASDHSGCPYPDCESEWITGGFVEINGNSAHQECCCHDCGRSWNDIYTLTGVELNDPVE